MSQLPFISICIPVYNGAAYLLEALESALRQAYPYFEVLIVDDNSTDNSIDIASNYSRLDSRIRVIQNPQNLGLVNNWNRCIELSKGEWIKFLFQDDILDPDCLEKMVKLQQKSPYNEKAVFCKRDFIFENDCSKELVHGYINTNFYWEILPNKNNLRPEDAALVISRYPGRNIFGEPTSFLIHRSVFNRVGLFDNTFYYLCDVEYWLRIVVNMPLLFIPETLVHFRVHNKSTTSFNRNERWVQMRYIDRLKLFYKFMYDELYSPLRKDIKIWPCRLFLTTQTAIFTRRAIMDIAAENENQKKDFRDYLKKYPEISALSKQRFYLLAIKYFISKTGLELKFAINNLRL